MGKVKSVSEEKKYLTALEQEKISELSKNENRYKELTSQIGDYYVTLEALKQEALQLKLNNANVNNALINELKEKYGEFQLGENFEIITQ